MRKDDKGKLLQKKMPFPRLTKDQCRRIHEASLEILARVGVRLDLPEAVDLLEKAGARVDQENLVYLPSRLVEKALASAPKSVVLHDRQGNPAMVLEGYCCFYGPGSDCLNIIDHRTHERRRALLKDVQEGIVLCDALDNIDFVMSMLLPSDVDMTVADRYQMEAMLLHTTKPLIFVAYEYEGCPDCVEMAEIVAGGASALRDRPNIACYINVVSGLRHNEEGLKKLLYLASKNIPALYIPSSTAGVTSPVTPLGALAVDNAGVLVGLVLSQLKREGAPMIISGMPPGHLDMKTMVSTYAEPERGMTQALAHYYGLPMFSLAGASESKIPDSQAAAEAALSLSVATLAGGQIIHDLGYLESGLTFSFVQLALGDEIVSWLKGFSQAVKVDKKSLGLNTVKDVGSEGQFLNTRHTLKHFRNRWYPQLFERNTFDTWRIEGTKSLMDRATERVEFLLAKHKPEPLPKGIKKKLREIVLRAAA